MGLSSMLTPSNRFNVNLVVLPMCADEPDKNQSTLIFHQHHQPVIIALDIKNNAVVCSEAGVAVCLFDVSRGFPLGPTRQGIPSTQRRLWFLGSEPKFAEPSAPPRGRRKAPQRNWCLTPITRKSNDSHTRI